jgi:hypothetical protein
MASPRSPQRLRGALILCFLFFPFFLTLQKKNVSFSSLRKTHPCESQAFMISLPFLLPLALARCLHEQERREAHHEEDTLGAFSPRR